MPRRFSSVPVVVAMAVAALTGACGTNSSAKGDSGPPSITHGQARQHPLAEITEPNCPKKP
jgi:hypothetical protein